MNELAKLEKKYEDLNKSLFGDSEPWDMLGKDLTDKEVALNKEIAEVSAKINNLKFGEE